MMNVSKFFSKKSLKKLILFVLLEKVDSICIEWITEDRLSNILSHIDKELDIKDIPMIIKLMIEDVLREAKGEIVESRELNKTIARETTVMFKRRLNSRVSK